MTIEIIKGLQYGVADGVDLLMDVYSSVGASNLPAVIMMHGGGWYNGTREDNEKEARGFAEAGYVAFTISYRLTATQSQFNDPYAVASKYPASPDDVKTALNYVRTFAPVYGVDPSRIAMFGTSAGAHLSLLTAYRDSGIKAVIGWSTPIEMRAMYRTSDRKDRVELFMGGPPSGQLSKYNEASPINYTSTAPPTLLIQGTMDTTVPIQQAKLLQRTLSVISPQSRFIYMQGQGHTLSGKRDEALDESIAFLNGIV